MTMATVGKGKTAAGPGGEVAYFVLNRLKEWGVERIFGHPEVLQSAKIEAKGRGEKKR